MLGQNFNAAMHRVGQQMPFHNPALLLAYSNHSGSHVACTCHDDSVTIFGINDAGAKGVGSQKILRRYLLDEQGAKEMAVAYSTELRERVVRAYQAGEGTQEQIAQRFQVSSSFVQRLLRGYRQSRTGHC
jgi:hypothetical protein